MKQPKIGDAFGRWLQHQHNGGTTVSFIERDDGFIETEGGVYFKDYQDWPAFEKKAINLARGRVLDVGCGAGRHALYLQRKKIDVTGLDSSPLSLKVCRQRGLRKTRQMCFSEIGRFPDGSFDTVVMMGNNFGLMGGPKAARERLAALYRITSPGGRLIAETGDPYLTDNPDHLRYQQRNRLRGRMAGQMRLRVRFEDMATPWFEYVFVSTAELNGMLLDSGWEIERLIKSGGPQYVMVLRKTALRRRDMNDAFGAALKSWLDGGSDTDITELDNGLLLKGWGKEVYFNSEKEWPKHKLFALRSATGRVLDVGCGAGRYGLFLQKRGLDVTGIDVSPLAAEVARRRGLRKAVNVSLDEVCSAFKAGSFDTVIMMGNNFGLVSDGARARRRLRKLYKATSPTGRILAETIDLHKVRDPRERGQDFSAYMLYHKGNPARGRHYGMSVGRCRFRNLAERWREYIFLSEAEMRKLIKGTGWKISRIFRDCKRKNAIQYIAELVKE
ncbi:MAG: class I SAM-dependent methyltransferase [Elusimicrobiota bacterium]